MEDLPRVESCQGKELLPQSLGSKLWQSADALTVDITGKYWSNVIPSINHVCFVLKRKINLKIKAKNSLTHKVTRKNLM